MGFGAGGKFDDSGDGKPKQARSQKRPGYNTYTRKRKVRKAHGRAHMMRAGKVDRVKGY